MTAARVRDSEYAAVVTLHSGQRRRSGDAFNAACRYSLISRIESLRRYSHGNGPCCAAHIVVTRGQRTAEQWGTARYFSLEWFWARKGSRWQQWQQGWKRRRRNE